jgi:hypothetical protein
MPSRHKPGELIKIGMHVDDLLTTCPTLRDRRYIEDIIRPHFEITTQYDVITYLGMFIKRDRLRRTLHIDQEGFTRKLVNTFGGDDLKPASTPAKADLFERDPKSPKVRQTAAVPIAHHESDVPGSSDTRRDPPCHRVLVHEELGPYPGGLE